jgi:DNA polymerase-3 subunit delta'
MKNKQEKKDWPLVGNSHIIEFLSKNIAKGAESGSYIFYGAEDLGKTTLAAYFAKTILCQKRGKENNACGDCPSCLRFNQGAAAENKQINFSHSDLFLVEKAEEKKNISIDQIRDFIRQLSLSSFLNSYKIGIIKDAHFLSLDAANALLKTLEEPKNKVIIILITSNLDNLPLTIISRSQILRFRPVKTDIIYDYLISNCGAKRSVAQNLSRLSLGRPALAAKFFENKNFLEDYSRKVNNFLEFFQKDISERFFSINSLLGRETGQESVRTAQKELDIWLAITRDLLLFRFGQGDLTQHWAENKELEAISRKINTKQLLEISKNIKAGKNYLEANVNPRAVMENIAVNIYNF